MKKIFLYPSAILFLVYLVIILLVCACNSKNNNPKLEGSEAPQENKYQLVWQDEFNYSGLPDSNRWRYDSEGNKEKWGNDEAQHYTERELKNAWVDNDRLYISAIKEQIEGKEFSSARLVSKAEWQHGKIEVKAKLPAARGTWSAIWMMPGGWSFEDGNWPDIGEIDIMEHVGHDLGVIHASAHSKDYQWQTKTQKTDTLSVSNVHEQFHSYILEWTPDYIQCFVDDSMYFEYRNEGLGESKWPYEKPFYIILNLAVGGAWGSLEGIDEEAFPQTMEIEYVRVYQLRGEKN